MYSIFHELSLAAAAAENYSYLIILEEQDIDNEYTRNSPKLYCCEAVAVER